MGAITSEMIGQPSVSRVLQQALNTRYIQHDAFLNNPPPYIKAMYDEAIVEPKELLLIRSPGIDVVSFWRFWAQGKDVANLDRLAKGNERKCDFSAGAGGRRGSRLAQNDQVSRMDNLTGGRRAYKKVRTARTQALASQDLFLRYFGLSALPRTSGTDRSISVLLADHDVWHYSSVERQTLISHLLDSTPKYKQLLFDHETKRNEHDALRAQVCPPYRHC